MKNIAPRVYPLAFLIFLATTCATAAEPISEDHELNLDVAIRSGLLPLTRDASKHRVNFPTPTARIYSDEGQLLYVGTSFDAIERLRVSLSELKKPGDAKTKIQSLALELAMIKAQPSRAGESTVIVYETDACTPCASLRSRLVSAAQKGLGSPFRLITVHVR